MADDPVVAAPRRSAYRRLRMPLAGERRRPYAWKPQARPTDTPRAVQAKPAAEACEARPGAPGRLRAGGRTQPARGAQRTVRCPVRRMSREEAPMRIGTSPVGVTQRSVPLSQ